VISGGARNNMGHRVGYTTLTDSDTPNPRWLAGAFATFIDGGFGQDLVYAQNTVCSCNGNAYDMDGHRKCTVSGNVAENQLPGTPQYTEDSCSLYGALQSGVNPMTGINCGNSQQNGGAQYLNICGNTLINCGTQAIAGGFLKYCRIADNVIYHDFAAADAPIVLLSSTGGSGIGTVNTSGTAVTWVSGDNFSTTWGQGAVIIINGLPYVIASVTSTTALVLEISAGTQTGVAYEVSEWLCHDTDVEQNTIYYGGSHKCVEEVGSGWVTSSINRVFNNTCSQGGLNEFLPNTSGSYQGFAVGDALWKRDASGNTLISIVGPSMTTVTLNVAPGVIQASNFTAAFTSGASGRFVSTVTGSALGFLTANTNFSVDGNGNISSTANVNIVGDYTFTTAAASYAPLAGFRWNSGTSNLQWSNDLVSWNNFTTSGGGVSSLNSITGAIALVGGTGVTVTPASPNITIAIGQSVATSATPTFAQVTTTANNGFISTVTGSNFSFVGNGGNFLVDGNGNISANGSINMLGATSLGAYRVGGSVVIDNNSNATFVNVNAIFSSGATGRFVSTVTGSALSFINSNNSFLVDGNGNISATGTVNILGEYHINSAAGFRLNSGNLQWSNNLSTWNNFTAITAVNSLNGLTGAVTIAAGTGISVGTGGSTITITNTGVTSLQGSTGAITLVAGTGVNITGLTISIGQPVGTSNSPTFATVFATTFDSTATGGTSAFTTNSGTMIITGAGDINSATFVNTNAYKIGGTIVINNAGTFVGAGVNTPLNGIAGAGFNPFVGGVQYFGMNTSIGFDTGAQKLTLGGVDINTLTFKGGCLVGFT
jgi:ribulose-5-phosphate 4-epimerase/fuculose-1-phosphate aldolase